MKTILWLLFFSIISLSASAVQFTPGQEAAVGAAPTTLDIQQMSAGKATFVTTSINAVYLGSLPEGVRVHYTAADTSDQGLTAYVVSVATNAVLANQQLCWRGVGSDWKTMSCAPMTAGKSEVEIDVGSVRSQVFALVPIIASADGKKQIAWAAHPQNSAVMLDCPGLPHQDMASVFSVNADGTIGIATQDEVATYQRHYATFCSNGRS